MLFYISFSVLLAVFLLNKFYQSAMASSIDSVSNNFFFILNLTQKNEYRETMTTINAAFVYTLMVISGDGELFNIAYPIPKIPIICGNGYRGVLKGLMNAGYFFRNTITLI